MIIYPWILPLLNILKLHEVSFDFSNHMSTFIAYYALIDQRSSFSRMKKPKTFYHEIKYCRKRLGSINYSEIFIF